MSTAQSVKLALQTALAQANAVTGVSDTDITGAIGSLIAGFGQGGDGGSGGDSTGLAYTEGSIVPAEDTYILTVNHGLGVVPRIFLFWIDISQDDLPIGANTSAFVGVINISDGIFSIPFNLTSALLRSDGLVVLTSALSSNGTAWKPAVPTSMSYGIGDNSNGDVYNAQKVELFRLGGAYYYRAGYTYKWLAIA